MCGLCIRLFCVHVLYVPLGMYRRAYIVQSIPSHKSDCKKVDLVIDIRPGDENISVLIDDNWPSPFNRYGTV